MRWVHVPLDGAARSLDLAAAETFLREHEDQAVSACARFIRRDPRRDRLHLCRDGSSSAAALAFRSGGILHLLLNGRALPAAAADRSVRSLQGLAADVESAEAVMAARGFGSPERIDYRLMSLSGPPSAEALEGGPEGLVIRPYGPGDGAQELYPLQEAYEREEVLPPGAVFNGAACRLGLERLLREQTVYGAELDGRVVAKANTNARAFTRAQLGGIYVLPEYRRRGIAARLTARLSRDLQNEGWTVGLFVKTRNAAALRAYEKIGFTLREPYRITYY